jgi:hypothetical protein
LPRKDGERSTSESSVYDVVLYVGLLVATDADPREGPPGDAGASGRASRADLLPFERRLLNRLPPATTTDDGA